MKVVIAAFALLVAVVAVLAQDLGSSASPDEPIAALERSITDGERLLADPLANDADLGETRVSLEAAIAALTAQREEIAASLDATNAQLETLGEASDSEAAEVAAERTRLTAERAELAAQLSRLDDDVAKATEINEQIIARRRELFSETLFRRQDVSGGFGGDTLNAFARETRQLGTIVTRWVNTIVSERPAAAATAALIILAGALGAVAVTMRLRNAMGPILPGGERPTYLARVTRAFGVIVLRTLGLVLFASFGFAVLEYFGLLDGPIESLLLATLAAVIGLQFALTVLYVTLAPRRPAWRLFDLEERAASKLFWLGAAIAVVFVFDAWFGRVSEITSAPVSLVLAENFIAAIVNGALLIAIARMRPGRIARDAAPRELLVKTPDRADSVEAEASEDEVSSDAEVMGPTIPSARRVKWPLWVRLPLLVVGVGLIVSAFLGYIALAQFTAQQIVVTGAILATMSIGIQAARTLGQSGALRTSSVGRLANRRRSARRGEAYRDERFDQIGVIASLAIGLLVVLVGVPLILLQWGFTVRELGAWTATALTGVRVGNVTVSLGGILFGLAVLAGGYVLTRAFQRWLDGAVLERGRVDPGVRNSIRTVVGYVGLLIVALFALSVAGVNFASLAVVAGALSVGIGFGLQNVVSNFVSGLILLAERPFKVGDIVETGAVTGIIQKISVRSTTIETFTKQSVIVPNSDLINGVVSNWTLGNRLTRADIPVGVSYDADPRHVHELLLEIARDHPLTLTDPEPMIVFNGFGASSLDFELRFYLANVSDKIGVVNEVSYQIHERLKAQGIEIPFPQRDLHIKTTSGNDNVSALIEAA